MKVLINSYACSPYKGSEPGMGWNFVDALSKDNDVYVITEKKSLKEDITRFRKCIWTERKYAFFLRLNRLNGMAA